MTSPRLPGTRLLTALVSSLLVAGCVASDANTPTAPGLLAAKGGPEPKVISTDPSVGVQGQRLNVRVLGSGYNATAAATWERNGAPDPAIAVNSTTFISSAEVVADITIAADADTALYDVAVEVLLSDGSRKKGVGIEKFEVTNASNAGGVIKPTSSFATATGAMVSDGVEGVNGFEDATKVQLQNNLSRHGGFSVSLNFQTTYNANKDLVRLGQGPCKYSGPATTTPDRRAALFAKLVDPAFRASNLWLIVDKPALGGTSETHIWLHVWLEGVNADSLFRASIGTDSKAFPGIAATVTETSPHVYRFTGGVARIWHDENRKNGLVIVCPNLDEAVVTWTPPAL